MVTTVQHPPVIEVRDLVKVYGETRAVDGVSFTATGGELFGVLGPNGAGKTTTIRILATLLCPTSGSVLVAGFDTCRQPHDVRKRLGIALQSPTLDAFSTGRETLELAGRLHRLPAAEIKRRSAELLDLMGLSSAAGKLTGTYSGGMKRRLDLAAALMHRPSLLILDEPTEGLDPQSRMALWDELKRINAAGTTMLLPTHYMEEADRLCSRLAIIDAGKIVVDGTPDELKASVGGDTITLELTTGGEEAVAAVRLRLADMLPADQIHGQPGGVTLSVPDAGSAIPALLRRLEGHGLHISALQMSEPSLDDVFLKYTGRRIREESASQPIIMGW